MAYTDEKFELQRQLIDVQDEIAEMGEDFSPKHLKVLVQKRERLRYEINLLDDKYKKDGKDNY